MSGARPPAVLIVNPNAGRMPEERRMEIGRALAQHFRVEMISTTARDSGISLAAHAVDSGADLVVAFGGDGLVNEIANAVAATDVHLGIIPGGTMNVFARSLGLPLDPLEAVAYLSARAGSKPRSVPLGMMDGRYFTFSAGCGFDAEAAEHVESHTGNKRRFGEPFFYWSAFRVLTSTYRHRSPTMTLRGEFGEVEVAMAIAGNAGPYAYLLGRPVVLWPDVDLDKGLDVFALRSMRIEKLPFYTWRVAITGGISAHRDCFYAADQEKFEIVSTKPFKRHVDGEPLPAATEARFSVVKDALKVLA